MLTWVALVVSFTGRTMVLVIHISLSCCAYKSTNRAPLQAIHWSTAITSHSLRSRNTVTGNAGAWLRTAQSAVATDVQKAADPDAAVLHLGTGNSYVEYICSRITQVQAGNSISDRSQLTCKWGKIWCGGVAGKAFWKSGDIVTLKTTVLRDAREQLIHDCGAV